MKFSIPKLKKDKTPSLQSLRPALFDINLRWFVLLFVSFIIFTVGAFTGLRLFYSIYSESFKKEVSADVLNSMVDVKKLKSGVENRLNFTTQKTSLPRDPSL